MALQTLAVANTGILLDDTPFSARFNAVVVNFTGGTLTVQGSDNNTDWTTLVSAPTLSMTNIPRLPKYIRVSTAATVYLLGTL